MKEDKKKFSKEVHAILDCWLIPHKMRHQMFDIDTCEKEAERKQQAQTIK